MPFFTPQSVRLLCETIDWTQDPQKRLDALGASLIVARALEDVQSEAVAYLYPQLKARKLIPRESNVDEGASSVVWHEYDHNVMAQIVTNYADDLPEVGAEASERTSPLKPIAVAYSYTTEDLRRIVFARNNERQLSLDVDKAMLADEAIERKIDDVAIKGDVANGLPGLCRNANVTVVPAAAPGSGADTTWAGGDKTPQEIFDDVVSLITSMESTSKGVHKANLACFPVTQMLTLRTTQFLTNTATPMTILEALRRQHPEVRFEEWAALEEGHTSDVPVGLVMDTRPLNMGYVVPMEARPQPPQPRGLKFVVPVEAKTGGTIIKRPLAVVYMTGL